MFQPINAKTLLVLHVYSHESVQAFMLTLFPMLPAIGGRAGKAQSGGGAGGGPPTKNGMLRRLFNAFLPSSVRSF